MSAILKIQGVSMNFGGIRALNDVDITAKQGEITALIGPNGAGKTTLFNCITGVYTPTEGTIFLTTRQKKQLTISGKRPDVINRLGLARTFQNIRLFPTMSVLENVMIGMHATCKTSLLSTILNTRHTRKEEQRVVDESYALLETVGLSDVWQEQARNLSYGAQRRLEIARALATHPNLICLDEPAAGMNPQETIELKQLIVSLRSTLALSILLIEHDMGMVMSLSDSIHVLEYGTVIASGSPAEISQNPEVIRAYLGEESNA